MNKHVCSMLRHFYYVCRHISVQCDNTPLLCYDTSIMWAGTSLFNTVPYFRVPIVLLNSYRRYESPVIRIMLYENSVIEFSYT